jgi:hypothetical protein
MARTGYTYDGGEAGALGDCVDRPLFAARPAFCFPNVFALPETTFLFGANRLGFNTRYQIG